MGSCVAGPCMLTLLMEKKDMTASQLANSQPFVIRTVLYMRVQSYYAPITHMYIQAAAAACALPVCLQEHLAHGPDQSRLHLPPTD